MKEKKMKKENMLWTKKKWFHVCPLCGWWGRQTYKMIKMEEFPGSNPLNTDALKYKGWECPRCKQIITEEDENGTGSYT